MRYLFLVIAIAALTFSPIRGGWALFGFAFVPVMIALLLSKIGRVIESLIPLSASTDKTIWEQLDSRPPTVETDPQTRAILVKALLEPESLTPRIEETFRAIDGGYHRIITRQFDLKALSHPAPSRVILPLMATPRSSVIHVSPLVDIGDTSATLLGASASKAIVLEAVVKLIEENTNVELEVVKTLTAKLREHVLRFGPDEQSSQAMESVVELFLETADVCPIPERQKEIGRLCYLVVRDYVVLFNTGYSEQVTAQVEIRQTRHVDSRVDAGSDEPDASWRSILGRSLPRGIGARWMRRWSKDDARYLFGLRPIRHTFDLGLRHHCQSYHMYFEAPDEQYVFETTIEPAADPTTASHIAIVSARNTGPMGYAHVFVRRNARVQAEGESDTETETLAIPSPEPARATGAVAATVVALEKPPGLLGITSVLSLGQTILIALVYVMASAKGLRPSGTSGSLSDDLSLLLAVLMVIPGVTASSVASTLITRRAQVTTISVVMGTLFITLLSIVSMATLISVFFTFIGDNSHALLWILGTMTWVSIAATMALLWKVYDRSMMFVSRTRNCDQNVFFGV